MADVSDLINAQHAGNVLSSIANPAQVNILGAYNSAASTGRNLLDLQGLVAQRNVGDALQQATDENGNVDYGKAMHIAAGMGPSTQMGMMAALKDSSALRNQQISNAAGTSALIASQAMSVMKDGSDDNLKASFDNLRQFFPTSVVDKEYARWQAMSPAERQDNAYRIGLQHLDQMHQVIGQTTGVGTGGQFQPVTINQPGVRTPGSLSVGPGAAAITPTPGEYMAGTFQRPATAEDVAAANARGEHLEPGSPVLVPGALTNQKAGIPVPPGLMVPQAGAGGGSGGGGVVGSDGKPVGPANPPRLLKVPGQDGGGGSSTTTPPSAVPPPPPGATTGAGSNYSGGGGIGAALAPASGAPRAGASLPVPPPPPPNAVPSPPAAAAAAANQPPAAVQPPAASPDLVASAKAQAARTGKPVIVPNAGGMTALPNGSVTGAPPAGAVPLAPVVPMSSNDSGGGAQVASTNLLTPPNVGAPRPPSLLVPGDVNAIVAGMNQARGNGAAGSQVAGFNTVPTGGPGYDEQVTAKVSQDRLAADKVMAANYANNVFPHTQALALLGRGMTTAPGADLLNEAKGWATGVYRSMGGTSKISDDVASYDSLHKWLSQIVSGNPVAQGSDARLAATLAGNANTGIHELASSDMLKAGIALMRMNATASSEWDGMPADQRAKYGGYYANFLRDFNKNVDPRAFAWDMYNAEQKKTLIDDLNSHRKDTAYAQKLETSLGMVRRNGYMGETRAMP